MGFFSFFSKCNAIIKVFCYNICGIEARALLPVSFISKNIFHTDATVKKRSSVGAELPAIKERQITEQ
jgi:hypothetical protein